MKTIKLPQQRQRHAKLIFFCGAETKHHRCLLSLERNLSFANLPCLSVCVKIKTTMYVVLPSRSHCKTRPTIISNKTHFCYSNSSILMHKRWNTTEPTLPRIITTDGNLEFSFLINGKTSKITIATARDPSIHRKVLSPPLNHQPLEQYHFHIQLSISSQAFGFLPTSHRIPQILSALHHQHSLMNLKLRLIVLDNNTQRTPKNTFANRRGSPQKWNTVLLI